MWAISHCVSNLHFLDRWRLWVSFMRSLAVFVSSLVKCLFFCPFSNLIVCFLLLMSGVFTPWVLTLCQVCALNAHPLAVQFVFHAASRVFCPWAVFTADSPFISFSFNWSCFWCQFRTVYLPDHKSQGLSSRFFSPRSFMVLCFTFKSMVRFR